MTPAAAKFRRLSDVDPGDLIALQNHPLVRRTLPLARARMDEAGARRMILGKEHLWAAHGYGPWAFFVEETFAGWGGLQPEGHDADLALVLHPDFWGLGPRLVPEILRRAFTDWKLLSVTVLLPPGRRGAAALRRAGFIPEAALRVDDLIFERSRLWNPSIERPGPQAGE